MNIKKIFLLIAFLIINNASAEFSYMDWSQTYGSSMFNLSNFAESVSKKNNSFSSAAKNHTNTFINMAPNGVVLLSQKLRDEDNKKKAEKVVRYNSWYNVESKQWRHIDLSFRDATTGDIAHSLINQIGKPAAFLVIDSKLNNFDRPKIVEYIPEQCRDSVVHHGKFLVTSGMVELTDAIIHLDSKKLDHFSKNTQTYVLAHATEASIQFIADAISPQESAVKSLICFAVNMIALGQINKAIKGEVNAANPGY